MNLIKKILELSKTLEDAKDEPTYITLKFNKGIPVSLNGEILGEKRYTI